MCIIKLSPICDNTLIDTYTKKVSQYHCSNTLPVRYGGLSGPTLIPYTTRIVKYIKKHYPDTTVIAGGGVRNIEQPKNTKILERIIFQYLPYFLILYF